MTRQATDSKARRIRLKPADPFELIRWLARSQSDPRKAVAELVQNSLDAGASHVRIVRRRIRKQVVLAIEDNGEGVIPELDRMEALKYLATHVGHSRKRGLSPQQRAEQVIAGQYGVGLLGFWAIGAALELRTRVVGSEQMALRLREDDPNGAIVKLPHLLDAPDTFTHVVVSELHPASARALSGRRLADYLAAELRGQLLQRSVELVIEDRLVRGRGDRRFPVVPRAFVGERLAVPRYVPVPGFPPASLELYFADGDDAPAIQVACAGTLVADDVRQLAALRLCEAPWIGCGLTGVIDFPGFSVPPGSRRGIVPNRAAAAFVDAMTPLSPIVGAEVERRQREESAVKDRQIMRDLRRALRGFQRRLPQYDFPTMPADAGDAAPAAGQPRVVPGPVHTEPVSRTLELFGQGPLDSVVIKPAKVEIAVGKEKKLRALPKDPTGKTIPDGITFAWSVSGQAPHAVTITGTGRTVTLVAKEGTRAGCSCEVHLDAVADGHHVQATTEVVVVVPEEADDSEPRLGIADPVMVRDPTGQWRSRMAGDTWQVNESHEDFALVRGNAKARMRYLLALLAKEMVQRSYGRPGDDALLEHMVEVLAHAERNLRGS